MGMPREALMAFMPGIVLFNFLKSTINAVITFLLYKRISGFLHR
jgi:riboflavin transporter FmnP